MVTSRIGKHNIKTIRKGLLEHYSNEELATVYFSNFVTCKKLSTVSHMKKTEIVELIVNNLTVERREYFFFRLRYSRLI